MRYTARPLTQGYGQMNTRVVEIPPGTPVTPASNLPYKNSYWVERWEGFDEDNDELESYQRNVGFLVGKDDTMETPLFREPTEEENDRYDFNNSVMIIDAPNDHNGVATVEWLVTRGLKVFDQSLLYQVTSNGRGDEFWINTPCSPPHWIIE